MNNELKEFAKENIEKMIKQLVELYEFQENIKITFKIKEAKQLLTEMDKEVDQNEKIGT